MSGLLLTSVDSEHNQESGWKGALFNYQLSSVLCNLHSSYSEHSTLPCSWSKYSVHRLCPHCLCWKIVCWAKMLLVVHMQGAVGFKQTHWICTKDIHIHIYIIYEKFTVQLASVGLAQAGLNNMLGTTIKPSIPFQVLGLWLFLKYLGLRLTSETWRNKKN